MPSNKKLNYGAYNRIRKNNSFYSYSDLVVIKKAPVVFTKNRNRLKMKIIGLHGIAGSGKDTAASMLKEVLKNKCCVYSFATPLKQAASIIFNLDISYFESSSTAREIVHPLWDMSPRQMLQKLGTDCIRNNISPETWVMHMRQNYLFEKNRLPIKSHFIITDVRFDNEADWIRKEGGCIIRINRENIPEERKTKTNHESENGLKLHETDINVDNNGYICELRTNLISELGLTTTV